MRLFDDMARRGAAQPATHAASYGKALFGWAVKRGTLTSNPFIGLPVAPIVKRDRVLSDEEIAAIWRATEGPGCYNLILRTLLLTGQRRDEVAGMTWAELSADLSTWTIPERRAKNRAAHIVPIARPVREIIAAAPKIDEFVFAGGRGKFCSWHKVIRLSERTKRLEKVIGDDVWSLVAGAAELVELLESNSAQVPNDYFCVMRIAQAWFDLTGQAPTESRNEDVVSGSQKTPFQRFLLEALAPVKISDGVIRSVIQSFRTGDKTF